MAEITFLIIYDFGCYEKRKFNTCVSYSGMLECEIYRQNKRLKERTKVYLRKKSEDHGLKGKNQQGNEAVDQ